MENKNQNKLKNLTKVAAAIFGSSIAALTGNATTTTLPSQPNGNLEAKTIAVQQASKAKPMPVLKLSSRNIQEGKFVAMHGSHASHSSHSSHYSHYSHRSASV